MSSLTLVRHVDHCILVLPSQVHVSEFGGLILRLLVPDKNGNRKDIVLGFDKLQEYVVCPFLDADKMQQTCYAFAEARAIAHCVSPGSANAVRSHALPSLGYGSVYTGTPVMHQATAQCMPRYSWALLGYL